MQQQDSQISVLIPTYNRSRLLVRTLDSVLAQTYPYWNIVIVDDGSTDDTRSAVESYRKQHSLDDTKCIYIYQKNQGKSAALNRGLESVHSEWIAFLDSDDVWLPQKLALQWKTLKEFGNAYGACFTDARYVNNPAIKKTVFQRVGRVCTTPSAALTDAIDLILEDRFGIPIQSVVMRTNLFPKTGGFDLHLRIAEDQDFIYRLAQATSLCFVNEPLVEIDRTPGRTVGLVELLAATSVSLEQHLYLYQKWLNTCPPENTGRRKAIQRSIQALHSQMVNRFLSTGEYDSAREQAEQAYKVLPSFRYWVKWWLTRMTPGLTRKFYGNADLTAND
jgi:Glycosyl transferase family 2